MISKTKTISRREQIENWLFPEQEQIKLEDEPISNKRFLFMSVLGIGIILVMELFF